MSYRRLEALANAMGAPESEPQLPVPESLSAERVQQELVTLFCEEVRWQYENLCKAQDKLVASSSNHVLDNQGSITETTQFFPEGVALDNGDRLNIIREEERLFGPPGGSSDMPTSALSTNISYTVLRHATEGVETVMRLRGEFCNENETPERVWIGGDNLWGDNVLTYPDDGSSPTAPSKKAFLDELDRSYAVLGEISDAHHRDPTFHVVDPNWPDGPRADKVFLNQLGIIDPDL